MRELNVLSTNQDPHAAREADKYPNPIPSREYILAQLQAQARPMTRKELLDTLGLHSEEAQEALRRRLRAMERDGQLLRTRRGAYGLPSKMNLVVARVVAHKEGYGFAIPEQGDHFFLNERQMRRVFHGDKVLVRPLHCDRRGRKEAEIVEVLESNTIQLVGRFIVENDVAHVIPSSKRILHDIIIPPPYRGSAQTGQIVLVDIMHQPQLRSSPVGKISEILGDHMAPGMEIDIAIRSYGLPNEWPQDVLAEVEQFSTTVERTDKLDRLNLTELALVTIDGEDAKDFDDAVYCEPLPKGGWRLYVAIADVAHYVKPKSSLDREATLRGNSVYFPGRVIPMLPAELSNGLCSLNPRVDRLCMVCEIIITASGIIKNYQFHEALMRSKARLTYDKADQLLRGANPQLAQHHAQLLPHLQDLHALYKVLHKQREKRGAIDFEIAEAKIIFGKNRKIDKIVSVQRNDAHRLIEECMLVANVCAAQYLLKHKMEGLFRTHAGPDPEKLVDLRQFLSELGLRLYGGKNPKPKDYAQLLRAVVDRPDAQMIQTVLLRSLRQAVYQPENEGHFGLAYEAYAHFTSPIRRYPDLLLHRAIKHVLNKSKIKQPFYTKNEMAHFGEQCSFTERRADDATRSVTEWLKCEFMMDKLGQVFTGTITGVTSFGFFVSLETIFVDGLVHISFLRRDYYHFDPIRHWLRGEGSGVIYRLGNKVEVRVARVALDEREIDFELVSMDNT